MERLRANDLVELRKREIDPETGFLKAPAMVARTGVQVYSAEELGLKGRPPGTKLRLIRPRDEVFAADAMKSFEQVPVTINHPPVDVDAKTWRDYAVGEAFGMKQVGQFVGGTMVVRDAAAVAAVQNGKSQLSCGYDFDLDETAGVLDGEEYDGVMRNLRGNHVAIVDTARGGPHLRISDQGAHQMETTKVKMFGATVRVLDAEAQVAQDAVERAGAELEAAKKTAADAVKATATETKRADDAATALAKATTDHATAIAAKDAEIATLKAAAAPANVEKQAELRATVLAVAAKVVDGFDGKGKTLRMVREAVLTHALAADALKDVAAASLGGSDVAKASDADLDKAFNTVAAVHGTQVTAADAGSAGNDEIARLLAGQSTNATAARDGSTKPSGREGLIKKIHDASRKPVSA